MYKLYTAKRGIEFRRGLEDYAPIIVAIIALALGVVFLQQIAELMINLSFDINL